MVGFRLALSGAVSDEVFDQDEVVLKLIAFLKERYPKQLQERFKLEEELLAAEPIEILEQIGKNRGCLLKGGRIDYTKVSRGIMIDFRQAKSVGLH